MSDTPRTDDEIMDAKVADFGYGLVLADFARTLERELSTLKTERDHAIKERDEANIELHGLQLRSNDFEQLSLELRAELDRVKAERDEDAKKLAEFIAKTTTQSNEQPGNVLPAFATYESCASNSTSARITS